MRSMSDALFPLISERDSPVLHCRFACGSAPAIRQCGFALILSLPRAYPSARQITPVRQNRPSGDPGKRASGTPWATICRACRRWSPASSRPSWLPVAFSKEVRRHEKAAGASSLVRFASGDCALTIWVCCRRCLRSRLGRFLILRCLRGRHSPRCSLL
jgi:hypothetical protein